MTGSEVREGRQLLPGQWSRVHVYDVAVRRARLVFESSLVLVEAPNVLGDGQTLVLNVDGGLVLLGLPDAGAVADETALVHVPLDGVPAINNDHVPERDSRTVIVSGRDGDLYRVWLDGASPAVRVTDARAGNPVVRKYYLHGIAPDGATFAAIVGERSETGVWTTDVALVDAHTGSTTRLTADSYLDDGCSFAADGRTVVFNTERFSPREGHAQLASMSLVTRRPVQLTDDERVNWFPHVAPTGTHVVYLSYPPGTVGHPADRRVELRLLPGGVVQGARDDRFVPETLVTLDGGQGTLNVGPWAPDGSWFAYCDYPTF